MKLQDFIYQLDKDETFFDAVKQFIPSGVQPPSLYVGHSPKIGDDGTIKWTHYVEDRNLPNFNVRFNDEDLENDIDDSYVKTIATNLAEAYIRCYTESASSSIKVIEKSSKGITEEQEFNWLCIFFCSAILAVLLSLLVYFNIFNTQWSNERSNLEIYDAYTVTKDSLLGTIDTVKLRTDKFNYYVDSLTNAVIEAKPVKISKHGGYWYTEKHTRAIENKDCVNACDWLRRTEVQQACLSKCVTIKTTYHDYWQEPWSDTTWSEGIKFNCYNMWADDCFSKSKSEYVEEQASSLADKMVKSYLGQLNDSIAKSFTFLPDENANLRFDDISIKYLNEEVDDQKRINMWLAIVSFVLIICIVFYGVKSFFNGKRIKANGIRIGELTVASEVPVYGDEQLAQLEDFCKKLFLHEK